MSKQVYSNDTNKDLFIAAKPIIEKYHSHLVNANIAYIWRDTKKMEKGETCYGEVKKSSDMEKHFTGADFFIIIYRFGWEKLLMPEKRKALMDHMLSHCKVATDKQGFPRQDEYGDDIWQLVKPDAELFYDVIRRHGAWNDKMEQVYRIAKRPPDVEEEEEEKGEEKKDEDNPNGE